MKNLSKILIGLAVFSSSMLPVFSTELPKPITDYIKSVYPKATVRFDGLVELPDGTQYLPVIPAKIDQAENPAMVVVTIPENMNLTNKPELILFANNYSLLKIIQKPGMPLTLLSNSNIPLVVKLGLLPQDFVVPNNFVIPTELKIIAGDLKIESVNKNNDGNLVSKSGKKQNSVQKISYNPASNSVLSENSPEIKDLADKTIYSSNFQSMSINVISPKSGRALKVIKLPSIPNNLNITNDGRYILTANMSSDSVSIIDAINNSYVKDIKVGKFPGSITISNTENVAYIANRLSSDISVLNLKNMNLLNNISVQGFPVNLTLSDDEDSLFYNDVNTGKIYRVDTSNPSEVTLITQVNNISKMLVYDKYLLVLSRTDNKLKIFDLETNKEFKSIEVGNKPVDIKISYNKNKIYILSAGSDAVNILDLPSFKLSRTISLESGGFPTNLNIIDSINKALVSYVDSYELGIIDLELERATSFLPLSSPISSFAVTP